jgi:quercetin dioxygenase-like cupin family protein
MKGIAFILSIIIASALFAPAAVLGQPTVTAVQEQRFQADAPPAQSEIVFLVLEFAPGVWLPLHTHPGSGYATVLDGALTRRALGEQSFFRVGEGWVDPTDVPHQAGNDNASPARIVATFVIPSGSTLTTVAETDPAAAPSPGATTLAQQRFEAPGLPSPLDIVHSVLEIAPGAQTPSHSHPGFTVVSVLEGSGTLVDAGSSRTVSPGVTWMEPAGEVHGATLIASAPVRIVVSDLLPRGAPLTGLAQSPMPVPVQLPSAR